MCCLSKLQIPQKPECLSPTLSLQTLLGTLPYPHRNYRWIMWVATLRSHVSNIPGLPLQTGKSISHKANPPSRDCTVPSVSPPLPTNFCTLPALSRLLPVLRVKSAQFRASQGSGMPPSPLTSLLGHVLLLRPRIPV